MPPGTSLLSQGARLPKSGILAWHRPAMCIALQAVTGGPCETSRNGLFPKRP